MTWEQLAAPPIFVVGMARSGTTWMYEILMAHLEVAGALETEFFMPVGGFGRLYANTLNPRLRGIAAQSGMTCEEIIAAIRAEALFVFERALEPHHRYFVEKTPLHIQSMPSIKAVFPEARFVVMVRDGRDVAVSLSAARRSWGAKVFAHSAQEPASIADDWQRGLQAAQAMDEAHPGHLLFVKYEALRADPFDGYRRLFDFCDIAYDEALLNQVHEKTDFEKNYKPSEQGFRRGARVGDWRTRFTFGDALAFNRYAGAMLIAQGYETGRFWLPSLWHQPGIWFKRWRDARGSSMRPNQDQLKVS